MTLIQLILESPYNANDMKNEYPATAHIFFTGCLSFNYFLCLYCFNLRIALTKSIKLDFPEKVLWSLKTSKKLTILQSPSKK